MSNLPHGTRSMYVRAKCRCEPCREANRLYYHSRQQKIREVVQAGIEHLKTKQRSKRIAQIWKPSNSDTHFVRYYKQRCPGVHGHLCRWKAHLRKDSPGGLCVNCRELLVRADRVGVREVRDHLRFLSRNGVGTVAVQKASGVSKSTLQDIKSGVALKVTSVTRQKILAVSVTDKAPKALVDAGPTKKRIEELVREAKMSKAEIATRIYGRVCYALQLNKDRITYRNALEVERLHRRVMRELRSDPGVRTATVARMLNLILRETQMPRRELAEELGWHNLKLTSIKGYVRTSVADEVKTLYQKYVTGEPDEVQAPDLCLKCGSSHKLKDRLEKLSRMLPCTFEEAREALPCLYPQEPAGLRRLDRDLYRVGTQTKQGRLNLWLPKASQQATVALP